MAEELRITTQKKPTYLNKSLAIGVLAGLCGSPIGMMWGFGSVIGILGAGTTLGIVGAIAEKNRIEEENKSGRILRKPTFFNKDLVLGGLGGLFFGSVLDSINPFPIISGVLPLSMMVAGATSGGNTGKIKMEKEYQQALIESQFDLSKTKALIPPQKDVNNIVPKENAVQDKKFKDIINKERLEKNSLENSR